MFVDSDGKYYYMDVSSGIMYQIIKLGDLDGKPQYGVEEQIQLRTIESHTSSEISQISNEIVLKVDENGKIVKVSLRGSEKGTEFKVNADNINLSASDVINLLSGGTINLSAGEGIAILSPNFSVHKNGDVEIYGDVQTKNGLKIIGEGASSEIKSINFNGTFTVYVPVAGGISEEIRLLDNVPGVIYDSSTEMSKLSDYVYGTNAEFSGSLRANVLYGDFVAAHYSGRYGESDVTLNSLYERICLLEEKINSLRS